MADLTRAEIAVVLVSATPRALDDLVAPGHGARTMRVASDEALVVVAPTVVDAVVRELVDRIGALDADALVLDVTDGWTAYALGGDAIHHALTFETALDTPADGSFVQGDVSRVGAKLLGTEAGVTILVPAYWGDYLRGRLEQATKEHPG